MNLVPEVGKLYIWRGYIWAIWEYTPKGFRFILNESGLPHHDDFIHVSHMTETGWSELTEEERAKLL